MLPEFVPGVEPMKILCFNVFFMAVGQVYFDGVINIKKHFLAFPILVVSLITTVLLQGAAIFYWYTITAVAIATSVSALIYFFVLFIVAARLFYDLKSALFVVLELFCLTFYMLLYYLILKIDFPGGFLLKITVKGLSLICYACPLIFVMNKRFNFIGILKQKLA